MLAGPVLRKERPPLALRSLRLTRKTLSKNAGWGLQQGRDSRESEWEYGEAGKGGKRRLHFKTRPPSPTANIGTSCIWFLS